MRTDKDEYQQSFYQVSLKGLDRLDRTASMLNKTGSVFEISEGAIKIPSGIGNQIGHKTPNATVVTKLKPKIKPSTSSQAKVELKSHHIINSYGAGLGDMNANHTRDYNSRSEHHSISEEPLPSGYRNVQPQVRV